MNRRKLLTAVPFIVGLLLIVATAWWHDREWFPTSLKEENTYLAGVGAGFAVIVVALLAKLSMGEFRSRTPMLMAKNRGFHYNPHEGVHRAGPYVLRAVGGISVNGFNLNGKDGTVVAPMYAVRNFGRTDIILGNVHREPFHNLPDEVKEKIRQERIPGPYFMVWGSDFVETHGADFTQDVRDTKKTLAVLSQTEDLYRRALLAANFTTRSATKDVERLSARGPLRTGLSRLFNGGHERQDVEIQDPHDDMRR